MCNWQDIDFPYGRGIIQIPAQVIQDACGAIWQMAQRRQGIAYIAYADLMNQLKCLGHQKINRGTIGKIIGEVSDQVSQVTNPSIYPSAIVVRRGTSQPGDGFWGLIMGTNPPSGVPHNQRRNALQQYQNDAFNRSWSCNC